MGEVRRGRAENLNQGPWESTGDGDSHRTPTNVTGAPAGVAQRCGCDLRAKVAESNGQGEITMQRWGRDKKEVSRFPVGWITLRRNWNRSISATKRKERKFKPQSKNKLANNWYWNQNKDKALPQPHPPEWLKWKGLVVTSIGTKGTAVGRNANWCKPFGKLLEDIHTSWTYTSRASGSATLHTGVYWIEIHIFGHLC